MSKRSIKKKKGPRHYIYFARTARAGRQDLVARVPELVGLQNKKIAVVGLGCLGAPSTLEFARCGVDELRVIDHDIVEAGTIVRWPFGMKGIGRAKTDVIQEFISGDYPYTKVVPFRHRIGQVRQSEQEISDLQVLGEALKDVDLVYDATAEIGLQHLLSDLAREAGIPYICISTTPGAWGGMLARIRPTKTEGCWQCLLHRLQDGSLPTPSSDPTGQIQPLGCADPTFTGASFDSTLVALGGVRLAISTLLEGAAHGYPSFAWDVAVVNLRDSSGNALLPAWKDFKLHKHPSCRCNASGS